MFSLLLASIVLLWVLIGKILEDLGWYLLALTEVNLINFEDTSEPCGQGELEHRHPSTGSGLMGLHSTVANLWVPHRCPCYTQKLSSPFKWEPLAWKIHGREKLCKCPWETSWLLISLTTRQTKEELLQLGGGMFKERPRGRAWHDPWRRRVGILVVGGPCHCT
jgi:hypothetical protein